MMSYSSSQSALARHPEHNAIFAIIQRLFFIHNYSIGVRWVVIIHVVNGNEMTVMCSKIK